MYRAFETISEAVDVCIIGGGAAGIAMAVTLAEQGYRILLCEGGDANYSERSQDSYRGDIVGDPYHPLETTRLRHLGARPITGAASVVRWMTMTSPPSKRPARQAGPLITRR